MKVRSVRERGSTLPLLAGVEPAVCSPSARELAQSKTWRPFIAALVLAAWPLASTFAQSYSIDWFTLDGGGGTSTNGQYSLTGTIGQPDAGAMSGGIFTLVGGFWGMIAAVQTPGAPALTVTHSNTAVVVSWPSPAEGWLLHATTNLVSAGSVWTEIPGPYSSNGANLQFTELVPAGNKFYRLHKP